MTGSKGKRVTIRKTIIFVMALFVVSSMSLVACTEENENNGLRGIIDETGSWVVVNHPGFSGELYFSQLER